MMNDSGFGDFEREVERLQEGEHLGRNAVQYSLLAYLVAATREGRSPKESELADAVFGRGEAFDGVQDASVRVSVHRLRKKMEDYYSGPGRGQATRLIILKGRYNVALTRSAQAEEPIAGEMLSGGRQTRRFATRWLLAAAAFATIALMIATWALLQRPTNVAVSPLWSGIATSSRSTVVVIGDYYIFGEKDVRGEVSRLVREYAIRSREDLNEWMMSNPEKTSRYADVGLRYYPLGVGTAMRDIIFMLARGGASPRNVRVIPVSDLTPETLRSSNIIYLGYFSGLGVLRNPVFNGSRFGIGDSYDQIVDKATGKFLIATSGSDATTPQQDFGYIARLLGPNGTSIVVIAGTRDAALMQAADVATGEPFARFLESRARSVPAYEAMLKVDTLADRNIGGRLLTFDSIDTARVWSVSVPQRFPDDPKLDAK